MPNLNFVLPHWLYWAGLVLLPIVATYFVRRQLRNVQPGHTSLPIAYFLLVTGGFLGLHRFYLRVFYIALVYIVFFLLILYGNQQGRLAREGVSNAQNQLRGATYGVERAQKALSKRVEGAAEKLARAEQETVAARETFEEASATWTWWKNFSGLFGLGILLLLILDAFLLPRLTRKCATRDAEFPQKGPTESEVGEIISSPASRSLRSMFTAVIDGISGVSGEFVCYWSIVAVFVYYYEVVARYVFNSPTNWAHEAMFLMFGMQYLLSGAFALREDSHVRVDVIYLYFPPRIKALVDVITSLFFFIFCIALFWTGWIFAADAVEVWEVSFTEWAIQYWPVKATIALGALFILLQGFSKLLKDLFILTGKTA